MRLGLLTLLAAAPAMIAGFDPMRVQLRTANNRFIRVDFDGNFEAVSGAAWLHGSTFTMHCKDVTHTQCKLLSFKKNHWMSIAGNGLLTAAAPVDGVDTYFDFERANDGDSWVKLKSQHGGGWIAARTHSSPSSLHANASARAATSFELITVPFIRGANLGSYFVPERWMVPSFYSGTVTCPLASISWPQSPGLPWVMPPYLLWRSPATLPIKHALLRTQTQLTPDSFDTAIPGTATLFAPSIAGRILPLRPGACRPSRRRAEDGFASRDGAARRGLHLAREP